MTVETPHWTLLKNAADTTPWHKNAGLKQLFFVASILYCGELLVGYDGTIIGNLMALDTWNRDLNYPNSSKIGLLNAAAYIVGFVCGPPNAWISDKYGRKWVIRIFGYTIVIGTILGVVAGITPSHSYGLFVASRAVIGWGNTALIMGALVSMQEISHPRYRATMAALWDCNWIIGNFLAAWVTFGCSHITSSWSWRIPYLIQLVPALYILVAIQFIPETPRYLLSKGRNEEARAFLVKYHGNGDEDDELVNFEWEEMKNTLALEDAAKTLSWKEAFSMPGNKKRLFLAGFMTFMPQLNGSGIISFYYSVVLKLVGITSPSTITGIGAGLSMFGLVCNLLGVWSLKYFRRRSMVLIVWPCLMLGLAGMAAAGARFEASGGTNTHAGIAAVVMVWLYNAPNTYVGPLFYSYPAEILNYAVRAKGVAVWNTVNQATGAYGAYVNSIALAAISWKYYLVYLPLVVLQWIVAYFFMVETKGYTLEEIAIAFEGADAAVAKVDAELKGKIVGGQMSETPEEEKDKDLAGVHVLSV
ncbi:putative hexose transport-related protein [Naematelia encephala]|uniref:Putative hexose transport-related protein n=1 Tax=Naematelia encephala TaxID=71784 RepID=A0A1Y2ARE2_9TREE|nr:putative hexose transport-related protein [Naematelia encephala]